MSRTLKPVMASTFLRDSSAIFARNNQFLSASRFNEIRDQSPADSRSRSPSVKRKSNNDLSYANAAKKKNMVITVIFEANGLRRLLLHEQSHALLVRKVSNNLKLIPLRWHQSARSSMMPS